MKTADVFSQSDYTARFEWGYEGVEHVGRGGDLPLSRFAIYHCAWHPNHEGAYQTPSSL